MTNEEYDNEWKNAHGAFEEQRNMALRKLDNESYNQTWLDFLRWTKDITPKYIYDIGCGAGVYYEVCRRNFTNFIYVGFDYAQHAIDVARSTWSNDNFICKDYNDIDKLQLSEDGILLSDALCESVTDGVKCLRKLLSLDIKHVILQRMILTENDSYFEKRHAYGINVVSFCINKDVFYSIVNEYGYYIKDLNKLDFGAGSLDYYNFFLMKR